MSIVSRTQGTSNSIQGAHTMRLLAFRDNVLEIFFKVLGDTSRFPHEVQGLIKSYLSLEERALLSDKRVPFYARFKALGPFPEFVNLVDLQVLKSYLGYRFQNDQDLLSALQLTKKVYESQLRAVSKNNNRYGIVYPAYPEILAYAMQLPKKETVLEIGGANGINAMLFAFTDARKVILNDIEASEIREFEVLKAALPEAARCKLTSIKASCFDLLKICPTLANSVDLVLCRNLIHFFNKQQQTDFFHLLKKLLKPGASAILTAISIYTFSKQRDFFEAHRDSTCFTLIDCIVVNYRKDKAYCGHIVDEALACPDNVFLCEENEFDLYQKNKSTDFQWQVDNDRFKKLHPKIKSKIRKACAQYKKCIESIPEVCVKVSISNRHVYNEMNLSRLISSHGFEIETTFVVEKNGHLINDGRLFGEDRLIGIVCKKPQG